MAFIYSRKRIRIPRIMYNQFGNNKDSKKILKFGAIVIFTILTFVLIINSVSPVFEAICKTKAKSIATVICNEESTKIIQNYKYEDLVTINKDENNNITMIKSNITPINLITSEIAEKIQKRIDEQDKDKIGINLGSFTGTRILSGVGPTIPIRIHVVGNVETDLRSEFKEVGINQTLHRIYIQVECKIDIVTPYKGIEENISNQVLLVENIIVGKIPDTYYNLNGFNEDNALDLLQ